MVSRLIINADDFGLCSGPNRESVLAAVWLVRSESCRIDETVEAVEKKEGRLITEPARVSEKFVGVSD